MKNKKTYTNLGFTLIELLVVVLIIGILTAIALPQYEISAEKARASQALTTLRTLKDALERQWLAKGVFPTTLEELDISIPADKYWNYSISTDLSVFAARKDSSSGFSKSYLIAYRFDNTRVARLICRSQSDIDWGEKICKALGAVEKDGGAFPYQNWILSQ